MQQRCNKDATIHVHKPSPHTHLQIFLMILELTKVDVVIQRFSYKGINIKPIEPKEKEKNIGRMHNHSRTKLQSITRRKFINSNMWKERPEEDLTKSKKKHYYSITWPKKFTIS